MVNKDEYKIRVF